METSKKMNTFIREFTRRAIKIPSLKPIEGCDWPNPDEECDSRNRKVLIESSSGESLEKALRYSLKSLDKIKEPKLNEDREYCSIGPEFQRLIRDPKEIVNITRAFSIWSGASKQLNGMEKKQFLNKISGMVTDDIQRRMITIGLYVFYFTIALVLLVHQFGMRGNLPAPPILQSPLILLSLFLLPLLTSFYIHVLYADRLRNSHILHILPLSILLTYVCYSIMIGRSAVEPLWKYLMMVSQAVTLILGIVIITFFRGYYDECHRIQTGSKNTDSTRLFILGGLGIILPVALTFASTNNL